MNEWNNSEDRFNSYDGCNSSGIHLNEKGPKQQRSGNRNTMQNRNKPHQENKKDSHYLAKIVQQNETIIGLLKGIKQALNTSNKVQNSSVNKPRYRKENSNSNGETPKKQYIQRFHEESVAKDGSFQKKRPKKNYKLNSDNSNVEVITEVESKIVPTLDIDFTSENEVGEVNPFTMFDSTNKE